MMEQAQFMELKLTDVIPTGDNPRQVNEDSDKFKTLAASVAADGVKEPVKVRPHPTKKGKYDLRDGARRHRASQLAKLKVIPALVYEKMTDAEAFEMTFIPFFGREDLTPIEESKAVSLYLGKYDGDTKVVADKLGQTERWVKLRANVYENLIRDWIEAVEKNEDGSFMSWTISHLELIARYDRGTQEEMLEEMTGHWRYDEITVEDLEKDLAGRLRNLAKAPWEMDDTLTDTEGNEIPPCNNCSKRTGHQPLLFADKSGKPATDQCTDPECWKLKQDAALRRDVDLQVASTPDIKVLLDSRLDQNERDRIRDLVKLSGHTEDYTKCKKADEGAVPCLVVGKNGVGKKQYRKLAADLSKGTSEPTALARSSASSTGTKSMKQKRDELGRKRWNQVLKELHVIVSGQPITAIVYEDKFAAMMLLIWQFGTYGHGGCGDGCNDFELVKELMADSGIRESDQLWQVLETLWEDGIRPRILSQISYCDAITQTPDHKIEAAGHVGRLLGISIDELHEKACKDIPEPKAWSKPAPQKAKAKKKGAA